jgi:hypothetical protein
MGSGAGLGDMEKERTGDQNHNRTSMLSLERYHASKTTPFGNKLDTRQQPYA